MNKSTSFYFPDFNVKSMESYYKSFMNEKDTANSSGKLKSLAKEILNQIQHPEPTHKKPLKQQIKQLDPKNQFVLLAIWHDLLILNNQHDKAAKLEAKINALLIQSPKEKSSLWSTIGKVLLVSLAVIGLGKITLQHFDNSRTNFEIDAFQKIVPELCQVQTPIDLSACQINSTKSQFSIVCEEPKISYFSQHHSSSGNGLVQKHAFARNITCPDDSRIDGLFVDNLLNGPGKTIAFDGESYEGNFLDGKRSGNGTLIYGNGNKYVGSFLEGEPSGNGTLIYENENKYEGSFLEGERRGNGTMTYWNGNKYEGEFPTNRLHRGTFSWANGKDFVGLFNNEKPIDGKFTFPDGATFDGKLYEGKVYGTGTYTWPDGTECEIKHQSDINLENGKLDLYRRIGCALERHLGTA